MNAKKTFEAKNGLFSLISLTNDYALTQQESPRTNSVMLPITTIITTVTV